VCKIKVSETFALVGDENSLLKNHVTLHGKPSDYKEKHKKIMSSSLQSQLSLPCMHYEVNSRIVCKISLRQVNNYEIKEYLTIGKETFEKYTSVQSMTFPYLVAKLKYLMGFLNR